MAFIDPQGRPVPADGIKPRGVGAWHVDAAENVLVLELREEAGGPVGFASSCFEKAEIQCSRGGEADALLVRARPVSDRDWEQLPASLDTPITLRLERFLLRLFGKAVSASDGTPIEQGVIRAQGPAEGPQEAEAQLGDGGSFTFSWPACNDPVELRLRIDGDIFDSQRKFSLPAGGSGLEGSRDVDLGEVAFEVRGSRGPAARAKEERGPPMVKVDLTKALLPLLVAPAAMAAWSPGPSLPEPRSDAGIAVGAADEIVVTGGCVREGGGGRPRAQVFVLDRGAAGWRVGPSLAEARAGHAVALDSKGRVFAIGGLGGAAGNTILASVETRDPVTGLWTFVAPLPVPTMAHKAVTAPDGKIWVLGGFRDLMFTAPINEVHIYDPVADAWSPGPSMLTPRGLHGAVVDPEGRIYAIGGAYTNGEVEVFDPAVGEWRSLPPLTQHPQNIGAAAVDPCGFIYVFGGYPYTPAVERYDPRDRVWDSADFLSTSRSNMGAATIRDGTIYVIGGTWEYDPVDTVDTLRVPCLQLEGSQRDWIPVSSSASKGILATSPEPIAGFSFGMRLDGTCGSIRIATMRLGSDTPVARPEYWAVSLYPELRAATAACIYSSDLSQWLPAGGGQEIARIVFSASKEDLGADCEISFAEGIGSPSAPIALLDANGVSHAPAVRPAALRVVEGFRRGESNGDGRVDIGDAVSAILQAFGGGASLCLDATDIDDDGRLTIQDAIYLLSWLFLSGRAIPEPGPFACGPDPTDDAIDCTAYAACE